MSRKPAKKLALVLSGGGARGAYEAGIIHYLRTMLPPKVRMRGFDILCGSSVGAINSCFLAATAHDLEHQGKQSFEIWKNLRADQIFRRDTRALLDFLTRGGKGMLLSMIRKGGSRGASHFPGFLDTRPFLPFLEKVIPWSEIPGNIDRGLIDALSISATNVFTGRFELFIQKRPEVQYTGEYTTHFTKIEPVHAKASAAIPIIFPTVMIGGIAYTDGGLRLNTPMSPAIQLGADAIFMIGLHHRGHGEKIPSHGVRGQQPSMGQVLGRVMNSIFLDRTQYDMEQLERINRVIDWGEMLYGKKFLSDLNTMLQKKNIRGDIANRGLKRLNVFRIRPSEDIGEMFAHIFQHHRDRNFTLFEKFMLRILDIDPTGGTDFLSYIGFLPEYLHKLLELGFEDARSNRQAIIEFLEG